MFLHLGNDVSIRLKDVIAIHDYGIFSSGCNREYIGQKEAEGNLVYVVGKKQQGKSLVVTEHAVYVSVISPLTLKRRAGMVTEDEKEQGSDSRIGA